MVAPSLPVAKSSTYLSIPIERRPKSVRSAINYNNFTIRVADLGLQPTNCSSLPRYSLSPTNFTDFYLDDALDGYHQQYYYEEGYVYEHIMFLDCSDRVSGNRKYVDTGGCVNWESKGYIYAMAVGDLLLAEDIEVGCDVKLLAPTSWWGLKTNEYSYATIHTALFYGFQLSWIRLACHDRCSDYYYDCHFHSSSKKLQCQSDGKT
ncbi:hypothetical protein LR48_Vigan04g088600 [Vigna angularis]|uniref:Uncharacterized protein n=1 Tax=Phaseolus angularis TaxID=3914 RepID=A0A0L9UD48_PHAAN|nr:hypothetical protein LR48_Vigan04g088600 [Vigna angularis]